MHASRPLAYPSTAFRGNVGEGGKERERGDASF